MIRRAGELHSEAFNKRLGGKGDLQMTRILEPEQFGGRGRLFARNRLKPGASIGLHQHKGDAETYYILNGTGTVDDNGVKAAVGPGDVVFTANGELHSIENTGTADLELKLSGASSGESSIPKEGILNIIRSLTPRQAAGNALAAGFIALILLA